MSLSDTLGYLQTINAGVSGIKSAPTKYPRVFNTAQLRMILTWPDACDWMHITAGDLRRQDRVWRLECYVTPLTQGQGIDGPIQDCMELLLLLAEEYLDVDNLLLNSSSPQVFIQTDGASLNDDGYQVLRYPPGEGTAYHGFIFRVRITEKW